MKNTRIAAAVMAVTLGFATLASAQPYGRDERGGPPGQMKRIDDERGGPGRQGFDRHDDRGGRDGRDERYGRNDGDGRDMRGGRDGRGAGPDHRFYRGDRLPPEYRNRQYVVDDWRGHRLSAPPRGQQWVQVGGDYVLAAIATGLITSLILNQ